MNEMQERIFEIGKTADLDTLLMHFAEIGASRIHIQTDKPVWLRIHGRNYQGTRSRWTPAVVQAAISKVYRSETATVFLKDATALDGSYVLWPDRRKRRYAFRYNTVAATIGASQGFGMVLRPLPEIPTPLEEQNVEPRLLEALEGEDGGYWICGKTGSGKTTLMGGINRRRLEDPDCHCDLIEGSAPLELFYDLVQAKHSTVQQVEIPRQLKSFPKFIEAAMRQEPTDITVGECRNEETMESAIQAMLSGHRTMSSLHTSNCGASMARAEALCPAERRDSLSIAFVESLRLIVNQRLLRSTDGKRTTIREFLPVTRKVREGLLSAPRGKWSELTRQYVEEFGQSYAQSIDQVFREGRISETVAAAAMRDTE